MDSIARWHQGSNPVTRRWAPAPSLQPDEILSSWLCRCAMSLGTDPLRFTGALWPGDRVWSGDLDRDPGNERLRTLATASGFPNADIERASLGWWANKWLGTPPRAQRAWPWIVPIGSRGPARTGIAQFCPRCWRDDLFPYYRVSWRVSWIVACATHGTLLLDRCPSCGGPPAAHRLPLGAKHLAQCDRCGSDLRTAVATSSPTSVLALQRVATSALIDGAASWWQWNLDTVSWFSSMRFWLGLLRQGVREETSPAASFMRLVAPDLERSMIRGPFDTLATAKRATLLAVLATIASLGGDEMLKRVQQCGVAQRHCAVWTQQVAEARNWLQRLSDGAVQRKARTLTRKQSQYGLGRPRPRHEVERMYRRLLREAEAMRE